jgi:hypothetical protein
MLFHIVVLDKTACAFLDRKGIVHPGPQKGRHPGPNDVVEAARAVGFRIADAGTPKTNSWSLNPGPTFATKAEDFTLMAASRTVGFSNSDVPCEVFIDHARGKKMATRLTRKLVELCGPQVLVSDADRNEDNWKFKVLLPKAD